MILQYDFNYNSYDAGAVFRVDTEKFKPEDAQSLLDFFTWKYDTDGDPIDELMKKYAMKAIQVATESGYNLIGVKSWFADAEGIIAVDGSQGVELISVDAYEFDEDELDMKIEIC